MAIFTTAASFTTPRNKRYVNSATGAGRWATDRQVERLVSVTSLPTNVPPPPPPRTTMTTTTSGDGEKLRADGGGSNGEKQIYLRARPQR